MAKRNKNRYQNKNNNPIIGAATATSSAVTPIAPAPRSVVDGAYALHEKEYRLVRTDLLRVLAVNILFLAGVLTIYFINRSNPFLQAWYDKVF